MERHRFLNTNKTPIGLLPKDWRTAQIKELVLKIGSGATPIGGSEVYLQHRKNYALVRSQNVFDRHFSKEGLVYISDDHAQRLQNAEIFPDDILLNITGDGITFGRACLAPDNLLPACVNQHVSIIRTDPRLCIPGFLLSYLTHPLVKLYIESFNAGGSRRAITKGHIESFVVPMPPLPEQRAIARVLGSLDDKIELNRNMNATLEDLARTLFKSWFIDFDPVHAKAAGRAPTGMDAATAALFPDSFENVQGRMVPQGWVLDSLTKFVEVNPQRQLANLTKAPYLDMKNMPTQGHRPDKWVYRDFGSGMRFRNGDTLVARITPCLENGKTAYVDFLKEQEVGWGSTEYLVLHPIPPLPPEFVYYLARNENFRAFVISNMTGSSGRQRVSANSLSHFQTIVPSRNIAIVFGDMAHKLMTQVRANSKQSYTLITLRDLLLPKLISGEVRVRDAERFVEEQL